MNGLEAMRMRWLCLGLGGGMLVQAFLAHVLAPRVPLHPPVPLRSRTPPWAVVRGSTGDAFGDVTLWRCDGCGCYFNVLSLTDVADGSLYGKKHLCPDCLRPLLERTEAIHGANVLTTEKP